MFGYYGSKKSIIDFYPPPLFDKVIEPFAGAAAYSMKYWYKDVTIVEKYEVLADIWLWLQKCSIQDINKLPHKLTMSDNLDNINFDCIEAKNLMGFVIAKSCQSPRKAPSARATTYRPNTINFTLNYIKKHLENIKHWNIVKGCYKDIPDQEATWFIDPPYQHGGYVYVENKIDYNHLRRWSKSRKGQIIVCENTKANWMDFKPMLTMNGSTRKTTEAIWSNMPTNYDWQQTKIF